VAQAPLVTAAPGAARPAVRLVDVGKRYGRLLAVDGVSLAVAEGQLYGLIGPDGAGKSTLLKSTAGVLVHDRGRVEVFGVTVDSERAAERVKGRLGFMPQGLGLNLYPELSVEENVDHFAELRLVEAGDLARRKARLLDITRLAPFRDRPMKHLSGGMKQKLGLVCTLIHHPDLVILDEPTTGVDPVSRRDFWTILAELMREQAITALVSTAYMDEASRFHRLAFVHEGRLLAEGEPGAVRARLKGRVVSVEAATPARLARLRARLGELDVAGGRVRALVPVADDAAALATVREALDEPDLAATADEPELEDVFVWLLRERAAAADAPAATAPSEPRGGADRPAGAAPGAAGPGRAVIQAQGLTRDFGAFRAVDDATFEVRAGEVFGLLGANGAGKTTVIKMLTGLLAPTAGTGHVAGVDMRRPGVDIKRRIGYMSQAFSLYHDLTVAENLALHAGIHGLSPAQARDRTAWVLAMGGLAEHRDREAGRLPMGLRQRLALGCALLHRPRALFLDEPTSGVDPIGRRRFWATLFALAREDDVAVLVTTHYMAEAERCDRLALMFAGRIVADAAPDALKAAVEAEAGRLLEVTTGAPERALAALAGAGFTTAAPFGRHVHLLSRDPGADAPRVRAVLGAAGVAVTAVSPRPLTMEEVFVHRVTSLEREAAARRGP
jgi:ABC-2 type transport system ATP-binding protein